jgi:hypothetical protein
LEKQGRLGWAGLSKLKWAGLGVCFSWACLLFGQYHGDTQVMDGYQRGARILVEKKIENRRLLGLTIHISTIKPNKVTNETRFCIVLLFAWSKITRIIRMISLIIRLIGVIRVIMITRTKSLLVIRAVVVVDSYQFDLD